MGNDGGADVTTEQPADDATDEGGESGKPDTETGGGCGHAVPPDPPNVQNAGGSITFVVAANYVDFGDISGDPLQIGYDLDMRCTCFGDTSSCMRPSWATEDACDGPEGRDNAGGVFIAYIADLFDGFGAGAWNESVLNGEWSLVLRIRDYNGLADDNQVGVDWYVPTRFDALQDGGSEPPKWDGTDAWPIRSSGLQKPSGSNWDVNKPLNHDDYAYVTGGVLVASMAEGDLQVNESYTLGFSGAFITAKLEEQATGWAITDGTLAARWKLVKILTQFSNTNDPIYKAPICTDNLIYPSIKAKVCGYADIYSGVGTLTTPCDSLSIAMKFRAAPARLGPVVVSQTSDPRCAPEVDPANDSCDNL